MTLTDDLLAPRMSADPAAPLITHYDAAEDSRIELSVVTTLNWAAKIAGFLRDGIGALPGDEVAIDLSPHWLSAAIPLGIWWAGCGARLAGSAAEQSTHDDGDADSEPVATICTIDRLDAHDDADELYVAGLDAFAMAPLDLPPGVSSLVAEARIFPDSFVPSPGAGAPHPLGWIDTSAVIRRPGRVLSVDPGTAEMVETLVGAFAAGGSLVLATGGPTDDAARTSWLDDIRAAEKVDG